MAILTNPKSVGETGVEYGDLVTMILHLQATVMALAAQLDNDGGITDTDYEARVQQVYLSGAQPIVDKITFAEIVAEYRV